MQPTTPLSALRPALRASAIARTAPAWSRQISSSRPARDDHHGHDAHASDAPGTPETFFSPLWRNIIILTTLSIVVYPFLPAPPSTPTSPSSSPDYASPSTTAKLPLVSRILAEMTPPASLWQARNDKHLELSAEAAEGKILFQEAERPKIHRLRNPMAFENASPRRIAVGSQTDLSDLVVKGDAPSGLPRA